MIRAKRVMACLRAGLAVAVAVGMMMGFFGCSGNGGDDKDKAKKQTLAVVDGNAISRGQFDAFLQFKHVPKDDSAKAEKFLEQYLEREALAAAIDKEELLDRELLQAELNEFRKEMLISRYFEKYLEDKVSDEAVANYYQTQASHYEKKKAHVAHILIRLNKKMSEEERKVKLTTAQEAYSKLRAGEDFAEIASAYSEDRISAKKGGDLGWMKEGSVDKRFSETVFTMKEGDFSEPFETVFGFHIVKLIESPQIIKQPLAEVKGDIRYQLRNQARRAEMERLLSGVKVENKTSL